MYILIPVSKQHLGLIWLVAWWWPVNSSKHVAYYSSKCLLCWRIPVTLMYTSSETLIILRRTMIKNIYILFFMKSARYTCPSLVKPAFSRKFFEKKKNTRKYQISWKSVQWKPESLHADRRTDGWTDMTKLTVAFRNFANVATKTGDVYVKRNSEARSFNHCCSEKEVLRIMSVCL